MSVGFSRFLALMSRQRAGGGGRPMRGLALAGRAAGLARRAAGLARRAAAQPVQLTPLALSGPTRTPITHGNRRGPVGTRRQGRAVVEVRHLRYRRAHALHPDLAHHQNPFAFTTAYLDPVANAHGRCGLGAVTVDAHVASTACRCRLRAGLGDPHRPNPRVYSRAALSHRPSLRACRARPRIGRTYA